VRHDPGPGDVSHPDWRQIPAGIDGWDVPWFRPFPLAGCRAGARTRTRTPLAEGAVRSWGQARTCVSGNIPRGLACMCASLRMWRCGARAPRHQQHPAAHGRGWREVLPRDPGRSV